MKLLALETTGTRLGVCLWEDFKIKAFKTDNSGLSYSHRLMPLMAELFRKARWTPDQLDGVGVGVGPGRFTGIRIGVSAARTLGLITQKPVAEVTSLETLAAQGSGWEVGKTFVWKFPHDLLCVLMDGMHNNDVYMAVWRFHNPNEKMRRAGPAAKGHHTFGHHFKLVHAPTLFEFKRFLDFFHSCFQNQTLAFVGSGAKRYRPELSAAFGRRARFDPAVLEPDPRWTAALSAEKFFRREIKSFNQVKPLYLRPSYVEANAAKDSRVSTGWS